MFAHLHAKSRNQFARSEDPTIPEIERREGRNASTNFEQFKTEQSINQSIHETKQKTDKFGAIQ